MPDRRLADLIPPPARRGFQEEMLDKIAAAERAATRRWRTAAIAAAVVAVAGATAAGVIASGRTTTASVDRTLTCPSPRNVLDLFAHVKSPSVVIHEAGAPGQHATIPHPALVELDAGRFVSVYLGIKHVTQVTYAGAYAGTSLSHPAGYAIETHLCHTTQPIPLGPGFLGPAAAPIYRECAVPDPAVIRLRVTLATSGLPVAAKLAVRGGAKRRPVAYVDWTPKRVRAWLAPGCQQYTDLAP